MTREEAIKLVKEVTGMSLDWDDAHYEALQMAIKALEQEPCEDAVSRKAVVEYIKNSDAELGHDSENDIVVEDILNMPTIIEADKGYEAKVITHGNCMMCGKELTEGLFFCKECEAKARQGRK
jgi:hypothetical protein